MRLFLLAAVALFILAVICLAVPTTIAGAGWPLWTCSGLLSWALEALLGPVNTWTVTRGPTQ